MSATFEGDEACLGIFMTRSGRDIVAAVVDLGRFDKLGALDQTIRQGRMPLLLSAAGGVEQLIVMPAINGTLRDVLVAGRNSRAMTRVDFVDMSVRAIRDLVESRAAPLFDLGFRELRTLSMSICLHDGDVGADDAEPFMSGTVH